MEDPHQQQRVTTSPTNLAAESGGVLVVGVLSTFEFLRLHDDEGSKTSPGALQRTCPNLG
jgi:hypothetical protein